MASRADPLDFWDGQKQSPIFPVFSCLQQLSEEMSHNNKFYFMLFVMKDRCSVVVLSSYIQLTKYIDIKMMS
jgi:hypothetical protein